MVDSHPKELPVPKAAANDARAIEILRIWAAGGRQHVSIATGLWDDPANWGIMLVDLARHIANAYEQSGGLDHGDVLKRLKAAFDAEWRSPTDTPHGDIIDTL